MPIKDASVNFIFSLNISGYSKLIIVLYHSLDFKTTGSKVWELEKYKNFTFGHSTTISGHFFCHLHIYLSQNLCANDHIEGQNVSKPNWIKIYDINQKNV